MEWKEKMSIAKVVIYNEIEYTIWMDDFAKEYFKKLKTIATDFQSHRHELAVSRIKLAAACLCRQLVTSNEQYDLLLGAGNSGLFMTKIAEFTYDILDIKKPPILNIPLYRFQPDGKTVRDNQDLLDEVKKAIPHDLPVSNVLFIDDEIMKGITAKLFLEFITKVLPSITSLDATIIAENHFFEWHYKIPKVAVRFFSYAPLIQGLNGNIGYFVPDSLYHSLSAHFPGPFSYNHAMAIMVGGALKRLAPDGKPYFDHTVAVQLREKIEGFDTIQKKLYEDLRETVNQGVTDYRSGKLHFRF